MAGVPALLCAVLMCRAHAEDSPSADPIRLRGAYVAKASECAGCHTAPAGGKAYAGGLGLVSPFGTIVSTNITPDKQHGIGAYSYDDFSRALRDGVSRTRGRLYPAMPYTAFAKMTDEDMRALYEYMMHDVAPVAQDPPPTKAPFPFNQRWLLTAWQWLFLPKGIYRPDTARDVQWNRGAYLVQAMGHCGSCHTPRGWGYQERGYDQSSPHFLTGFVNEHWHASNLTGAMGAGLGRVSESDLASFLKTGHGGGLVAYGNMVQTVENSLQYLSDGDLAAIAGYLKSLPAQNDTGTYRAERATIPRGAKEGNYVIAHTPGADVYRQFCARCHAEDGQGVRNVYPRLAGNPSLLDKEPSSLIRLTVEGGNSPNTIGGPARQNMPGFAGRLTDVQIAQVLTYIRSSWGNDAKGITAVDVAQLRKSIHK
ncbi:MAG: alcohol dehydrogenase [Betaproteobacteria bacterium]|nr:alcohol dehydrogenase [Betaproteobacteria bacterium]